MNVVIIGNPDIVDDSMPHRLLSGWKNEFPQIDFFALDPNEEIELGKNTVIIDTVQGIKETKLFTDLDSFTLSPRVSLHDFDLLDHLKLYKKINPDCDIRIIGIPQLGNQDKVNKEVINLLSSLL